MADEVAKFEFQRMQFAASLASVAEAMRNAASLAEDFATIVKNAQFSTGAAHASEEGALNIRKRKAEDSDDKGGKRKRKPKDPNAPKRPASAYLMFQNEIRKEMKEKHPNISNTELMNMIAKMWQEMTEEAKAAWVNAAHSAKEQYTAEKAAYDARSPEEVEAANAAAAAAAEATKAAKASARKNKEKAPAAAAAAAAAPVAPPPPPAPVTEPSEVSDSEEEDEEEVKSPPKSAPKTATPKSYVKPPSKKAEKPAMSSEESSEEEDEEEEEEKEPTPPPPPKKAKGRGFNAPASLSGSKKKRGGK